MGPGDDELRQSDLSHLRLQEMSPAERAELKRRYDRFIRHFGRAGAAPRGTKKRLRKWVPDAKK